MENWEPVIRAVVEALSKENIAFLVLIITLAILVWHIQKLMSSRDEYEKNLNEQKANEMKEYKNQINEIVEQNKKDMMEIFKLQLAQNK